MAGNVVILALGAMACDGREEAYEQRLGKDNNAETFENVGPKSIYSMSGTTMLTERWFSSYLANAADFHDHHWPFGRSAPGSLGGVRGGNLPREKEQPRAVALRI